MVSQEFVSRILNKKVHVDYYNEKTGQEEWLEGTLSEYNIDEEDHDPEKSFFVIESETDYDRIPEYLVRKIYLKE